MVLIADPEIEQGKATASALVQWGFQPTLVHDGVEAILAIQRLLPRAIVIDAALPKMFGFQVCELVKRNESLRHIHVVLVGAIHDKMRYRRPPEEIYGADAYIERQELTRSLRSILQGFGMSASADPIQAPQPAAPAPRAAPAAVAPEAAAPTPSAPPAAVPAELISEPPIPANPIAHVEAPPAALSEPEVSTASPSAESIASTVAPSPRPTADPVAGSAPAGATPSGDARIQEAERLARIVVSDIVLYSKEKFDAAVAAGNVLEAMEPEIAEGRSLFTSRVDPEIQQMRDFLADELLRVAETKGKP